MSPAILLDASSSAAVLPAGIRRAPRAPTRSRPREFLEAFDAEGMFYDCFWHVDGQRVLLAGPPPVNVEAGYRLARFAALPSRQALTVRFHISLSAMITELGEVPDGSNAIEVSFGGETVTLPIQPNLSKQLAGKRLLFSMNRNNDLKWIREWAAFHARLQGTDTVVLFDNGSTSYATEEIAETLRGVPGLSHVAVPVWRQRFGRTDPAVRLNPYWAHFPQIASMSDVLRRYGAEAAGILNADIDELVETPNGQSIYDVASATRHGLAVFRGRWIEAVPLGDAAEDHRGFGLRYADPKRARARPNKWALDPRRGWVANLDVHPYWHWIAGRPMFAKVSPPGVHYWHFRGISTNWKVNRTASLPARDLLEADAELAAAFAKAEDA